MCKLKGKPQNAIVLKTTSVLGGVKFEKERGFSYPESLTIPLWLECLNVEQVRAVCNAIGKLHYQFADKFDKGLEKTYILTLHITLVEDKTKEDKLNVTATQDLN